MQTRKDTLTSSVRCPGRWFHIELQINIQVPNKTFRDQHFKRVLALIETGHRTTYRLME